MGKQIRDKLSTMRILNGLRDFKLYKHQMNREKLFTAFMTVKKNLFNCITKFRKKVPANILV